MAQENVHVMYAVVEATTSGEIGGLYSVNVATARAAFAAGPINVIMVIFVQIRARLNNGACGR
jgi:hypothetical protein